MNYDEYYLGLNNSMHPANEIEVNEPIVIDELEILKDQVKSQTERLNYKIWQLKQLSSIEQYVQTFGKIEHDQNLLRIEILNQYL
jgi:hypothetical protein